MVNRYLIRLLFLPLLACAAFGVANAQHRNVQKALKPAAAQPVIPRVGQHFTFAVIEGPDLASTIISNQFQSQLFLYVTSNHSGCGTITSPNGYTQSFTFNSFFQTVVPLDYKLMQLTDLGKTNKGLLVATSQPVNLVFHDFAQSAGDATQLYPDEALDTSYVISGWGLFDDASDAEDNRFEFAITAPNDNTQVTVVPQVSTLLGQPELKPFTITLNRGECYIVKADTTNKSSSVGHDYSLSGSTVVSDKPVSVITGTTCAYLPTGFQSCNEVMDEELGKKYWGNHFFVQPMGDHSTYYSLVITSDADFAVTLNSGGGFSTQKRSVQLLSGAVEITTDRPAQVRQFTRGSDLTRDGIGDPSMVTILPTTQWADTLLWYSPNFSFENWVSIVFPTADAASVILDGKPITTLGAVFRIDPQSPPDPNEMSGLRVGLDPGVHNIYAPHPVFALAAGFESADAYSFLPGTVAAAVPLPVVKHSVLFTSDTSSVCEDIHVHAITDVPLPPAEGISVIHIPITYDPALLQFKSLTPGALLNGALVTVFSSTPGLVDVTMSGKPTLSGSDDLFTITFRGIASTLSTAVKGTANINGCAVQVLSNTADSAVFPIFQSNGTTKRVLTFAAVDGFTCKHSLVEIKMDSTVTDVDGIFTAEIIVTYDITKDQLAALIAGPLLRNATFVTDTSVAGIIKLEITSTNPLDSSDLFFTIDFLNLASGRLPLTGKLSVTNCVNILSAQPILTGGYPVTPHPDTSNVMLSVSIGSVLLSTPATATISVAGLPADAHSKQFDLSLHYDHNILTYNSATGIGLAAGWAVTMTPIDKTTDKLTFTSTGAELAASAGQLASVLFETFVADSAQTQLGVSGNFVSGRFCPFDLLGEEALTQFTGIDTCGTALLRNQVNRLPLSALGIAPDPSSGEFTVYLQTWAESTDADIQIVDLLGRPVWQEQKSFAASGRQQVNIKMDRGIPSGRYVLRISSGSTVISSLLTIRR